jgi:DNA-binding beta-propeller fold protein YncE
VSERYGQRVVRVNPDTGTVVASIDVGGQPFTLQPADGRMWVLTGDRYVAIDPATKTITATLTKADVGPAANRSWAGDGHVDLRRTTTPPL